MSWETTGTVTVTNNSATVTGSGTLFTVKSRVGDAFIGPDGALYEIVNIVSNTVLSISPTYKGVTGSAKAYKIAPVRGYQKLSADRLYTIVNMIGDAVEVVTDLPAWLKAKQPTPVSAGGTGAETQLAARQNLGLKGAAVLDIGTAAGTVAAGDDARLTDAREWIADTIPQAEAEGGSATTRRAWTSQRVKQAFVAFFGAISSSLGRTLIGRATPALMRGDLELGSAATGNVVGTTGASTTDVMSQKAVTEQLATKADTSTQVIAGTGLIGGGNLGADRTLSVNYGTAAGTAAQGNDSRLSNSREWTAATITQAEAEAGVATTRRAFTAQQVRQAIVAWFNGISGALGRTILTRATADQVRSDIGLGTAATADLTTSNTDGTAGRVLKVGDFGVGLTGGGYSTSGGNDLKPLGFHRLTNEAYPSGSSASLSFHTTLAIPSTGTHLGTEFATLFNSSPIPTIRVRSNDDNSPTGWNEWRTIHHSGNLLQTTGSSTDFPMSQAAVTNQLATLGTAATANLTTSNTDGNIGRVLKVGDGGVLSAINASTSEFGYDFNSYTVTGTYWFTTAPWTNLPVGESFGHLIVAGSIGNDVNNWSQTFIGGSGKIWYRLQTYGSNTGWRELYHTSNLLNIGTTADSARSALGLGSAARYYVGTATGNVLQVGAFGLGGYSDTRFSIISSGIPSDVYGKGFVSGFTSAEFLNPAPLPGADLHGTLEVFGSYIDTSGSPSIFRRFTRFGETFISHATYSDTWSPWAKQLSTNDILQTTGTSPDFPMSQKATTDAIANIPSVPKSEPYAVTAADKGKSIDTGYYVYIPASLFAVGDVIVVTNTSDYNINIEGATEVTVRLAGTASTGMRTLAGYGVATFRMVSNNVWFGSGAGLS